MTTSRKKLFQVLQVKKSTWLYRFFHVLGHYCWTCRRTSPSVCSPDSPGWRGGTKNTRSSPTLLPVTWSDHFGNFLLENVKSFQLFALSRSPTRRYSLQIIKNIEVTLSKNLSRLIYGSLLSEFNGVLFFLLLLLLLLILPYHPYRSIRCVQTPPPSCLGLLTLEWVPVEFPTLVDRRRRSKPTGEFEPQSAVRCNETPDKRTTQNFRVKGSSGYLLPVVNTQRVPVYFSEGCLPCATGRCRPLSALVELFQISFPPTFFRAKHPLEAVTLVNGHYLGLAQHG